MLNKVAIAKSIKSLFNKKNVQATNTLLKISIVIFLVSNFFLYATVTTQAGTFTVNKTADTNDGVCDNDCSLREAIEEAIAANVFLDQDFDPSTNSDVYAIETQSDGKILIGGFFTFVGNTARNKLARLNADGSLDTTFANPNLNGTVFSLAVLSNGKILVGGDFGLVQLNSDGTSDNAFNANVSGRVLSIEVQTDGKILVGGFVSSVGGVTRTRIARLNSNGTLDTSFNPNVDGSHAGYLKLQPDGKIVVGGNFISIAGTPRTNLARLNSDGSADNSFTPDPNNVITANIVLQSDGKIFVGGNFDRIGGKSTRGVVRLNTDGTVDTSFDLGFNHRGTPGAIAVQSDGKVLIGGVGFDRVNSDGSLDHIFFRNGFIDAMKIQADGEVLVGGAFTLMELFPRNRIARLNKTIEDVVVEFDFTLFGQTPQTITLGGNSLFFDQRTVTINGPGADLLTIDANNSSRAFFIDKEATVDIKGFTVTNGEGIEENGWNGGGGIINLGTLRIENCVVKNSSTPLSGGGGINSGGFGADLTVENCEITDNAAPNGSGGGLQITSSSVIKNSTISNNTSIQHGGGISYPFSSAQGSNFISNSTISNNSADSLGGGIIGSIPDLNISSSTISNNTGFGGGIWSGGNFGVKVRNTILANNLDNNNNPSDFVGPLMSEGYNLIRNTNGTTINGDTTGNIIGVDPQLDPNGLQDNGGPTQTIALISGSPAIDAADPKNFPTEDQRNVTRPFDGDNNGTTLPDIGAFEFTNSVTPSGSAPFDFDGDGKTDIGIFRPNVGEWWYLRSSDLGNGALQFGSSTDIPVPADFTGDGKTDIAFWRNGEYFVLRSEDDSFFSFPWGQADDVPAPGDYDGDGNADPAVFRPSDTNWYILKSTGGVDIIPFGIAEDKPVIADYDGDGKDDIGVYRPSVSEWWINQSTDGVTALQFGSAGDRTTQGDYTGDGKADVSFFRPTTGEWFIIRSEDNSFFSFPFGTTNDIPAPGDYDGDGTMDTAVFRESETTWYLNTTSSGVQIVGFGLSGDIPIPSVYSVP